MAADAGAVTLATEIGTSLKDTALGVFGAIAPLAVGVLVAKRAFSMARGWIG